MRIAILNMEVVSIAPPDKTLEPYDEVEIGDKWFYDGVEPHILEVMEIREKTTVNAFNHCGKYHTWDQIDMILSDPKYRLISRVS